jgi:hypothetical protein
MMRRLAGPGQSTAPYPVKCTAANRRSYEALHLMPSGFWLPRCACCLIHHGGLRIATRTPPVESTWEKWNEGSIDAQGDLTPK